MMVLLKQSVFLIILICSGVQWHAEYEPEKNELNKCLFDEFGSACSIYSKKVKIIKLVSWVLKV